MGRGTDREGSHPRGCRVRENSGLIVNVSVRVRVVGAWARVVVSGRVQDSSQPGMRSQQCLLTHLAMPSTRDE